MVNHLHIKQVVKLLITVLLPVLITKHVCGQQFSSLYFDNRPAVLFGSVEEYNNAYYTTGVTAGLDTPTYVKALFAKVNTNGNMIYIHGVIDTLPYSYQLYWNTLKKTKDGNLLACGEMVDTTKKVFVAKFDTTGSILFYASFMDTSLLTFQAKNVIELSNGEYIIAINAQYKNYNSVVMFIKLDNLGNIVIKKNFDLNATELPWLIRPMLNGNYMIGAVSYKTNNNSPFWCRTWLIEIDSMGNYVNQWIDNDTKNLWPYGMQQTADSGWIIVRQHVAYDVAGLQLYNASVIKLDKNFTKEWEVIKGDSGFDTGLYDVEILQDGKYIVCGTTPEWGTDSAHHFGWILKIDTDGTILWERKYVAYERFGTYSFLYDIDVLSNGDLLACGELRFTTNVGITPIQQGWILRTDSNGCVIENCMVNVDDPNTEAQEIQLIKLLPNPAINSVLLQLDDVMLYGELKIYDVAGKKLLQKNLDTTKLIIDVSGFSKGIYMVVAQKGNKIARTKLLLE